MALDRTYGWFIEGDKIAIIQSSENDNESAWSSIGTADKTIRIFASHLATDFNSTLTDDDKTYNLDSRFRDILAYYVIAIGYERQPNQDFKAAGYFLNKFRNGIREIKKSKNYRKIKGSIMVVPHFY